VIKFYGNGLEKIQRWKTYIFKLKFEKEKDKEMGME
jgi:hypothetical protein